MISIRLLFILFFFISSSNLYAAKCVKFPSGTPVECVSSASTTVVDLTPNVGIGSTAPGTALDVQGTARALAYVVSGSTPGYIYGPNGIQIDPNNATGTSLAPTFSINTSGNVGIGTIDPTQKLHVKGGISYLSNLGGNELVHDLNGTNFGAWYNSLTDSTLYYGPTTTVSVAPTAPLFTLGTDSGNVGIGTDLVGAKGKFIVIGGNVGIGTRLPGTTLDVTGTIRASTSIGVGTYSVCTTQGTCPGSGGGTSSQWSTQSGVGIGTAEPVAVGTYTPASVLTVSGGVGVGTNNSSSFVRTVAPTGTVNIEGNVGIGTITPKALLNINSSAAQDLLRIDDSAGADATPLIINQSGNVGIGTADPQAVVQITSTLVQDLFRVDDNGAGDLSPFIIDKDGHVGIGTTLTQTDSLLIMGGNVGIGTWIPATALDVKGTFIVSGNVGIGSITPGQPLDIQGAMRQSTNPTNCSSGNHAMGVDGSLNAECASDSASASQWFTQSGIGIGTFNAVGIGSSTFGNQLSVAGNVGIGTTPTSVFVTTAPSANGFIIEGNVGIGTTKNLQAALTVMNGNVGIGTWVPGAMFSMGTGDKFQIDNSGTIVKMINSTSNFINASTVALSNNTGQLLIKNNASGSGTSIKILGSSDGGAGANNGSVAIQSTHGGGTTDNIKFNLFDGTTKIIMQDSSGIVNMGIGTTTPQGALVVMGGNVGIGTWLTPGGSLIVKVGNVGIGTDTPGATFDVNGGVRLKTSLVGIGTLSVGASVQIAANQACNTTCTNGACFMGEDTSVLGSFVDCADATADRCICIDGLTGL